MSMQRRNILLGSLAVLPMALRQQPSLAADAEPIARFESTTSRSQAHDRATSKIRSVDLRDPDQNLIEISELHP